MDRYDILMQILKQVSEVNEELKKYWKTEASVLYTSSLDDALEYMKQIVSSCSISDETLSDFSFD